MKILLIEHHALFREGLRHMLQKLPCGVEGILEAGSFSDGLDLAGQHNDLGVVLMELNAPGCNGAPSIKLFHQHYPQIPVVVLSSEEEESIVNEAMNHGASGFVHKSSNEATLLDALNLVLSGNIAVCPHPLWQPGASILSQTRPNGRSKPSFKACGLTVRHLDVLQYLAAGYSKKEIANTLGLTVGTVKAYVAAIYKILQVRNRVNAGLVARQLCLDGGCHFMDDQNTINQQGVSSFE